MLNSHVLRSTFIYLLNIRISLNRVALSVDGAFSTADGSAAGGMILRRHDGSIIFAAYRCLAELHALMQGIALAVQHSSDPIMVQSDSAEALTALTGDTLSRSTYGHLVAKIKHLMVDREFIPLKIKREQNRVAYRLALYRVVVRVRLMYG